MSTIKALGRYQIVELLGSGANADVYHAMDITLGRHVALKVLKPNLMVDPENFARFTREAQTAAILTHPQIAWVWDIGQEGGYYYLATRLIEGPSLDRLLQERGRLPWNEALAIASQIGEALEFAHARGFIHRDVKPQNILVSPGEGAVLSDFGLVRSLQSSGVSTQSGAVIGTLPYIPPEIWDNQPATPAADQYALACVVAEMLSGKRLYDGSTPPAIMRQHFTAPEFPEPWPEGVPLAAKHVLSKALSINSDERYANIGAFIAALAAVRLAATGLPGVRSETPATRAEPVSPLTPADSEPQVKPDNQSQPELVEAPASDGQASSPIQPATTRWWKNDQAQTWQMRWSFWAGILALVVMVIIIGLYLIFIRNTQAPVDSPLSLATATLAPSRQATKTLTFTPSRKATATLTLTPSRRPTATLTLSLTPTFPLKLSIINPENVGQVEQLARWAGDAGIVAWSPDGELLGVASFLGTYIYLYDSRDFNEVRFIDTASSIHSVAFSPDWRSLASGSDDNTVRLWDVQSGKLLHTLEGHTSYVSSVAFSPDGRNLASGSDDLTIRLWEVQSGELQRTLVGHTDWVSGVAFSPDGHSLASGDRDNTIRLWDVQSGQLLRTLVEHTNWVTDVAFSPDGRSLASGSWDNTVRLWDVQSGQLLRTLVGHTHFVHSVAFSPDGRSLASGSSDENIILWDVQSGNILRTLEGHTNAVISVAFSPDGRSLASGSWDDTIRLWGIPAP